MCLAYPPAYTSHEENRTRERDKHAPTKPWSSSTDRFPVGLWDSQLVRC